MPTISAPVGAASGRGAPANALRILAAAACLAVFSAAGAQDVDPNLLSRDLYHQRLLQEGNAITFCYNEKGMMADFEVELAGAIGDVLLVEARVLPIPDTLLTTPPLDYRLPLLPEQLYVLLAETCSAVLGYALAPNNPEWLAVSRPYMQTRTLLVAHDPAYGRLADVPLDRPIGSRAMSIGDNRLIGYLQAQPADRVWRRFPYYDNQLVLERLGDGTVGAGLVWEPALYFATDGDPEAAGYHILADMPFQVPSTDIGIATRSDDSYLNATLGTAIDALAADGTLAELLLAHHLAPPADAAGH